MESNEFRDLDRIAERAEAAPWVDYPPTPSWYPPATGLWAAAMTFTLDSLGGVAGGVTLGVLVALEIALLWWYRSYRGLMPSGPMPSEIGRAALVFAGGLVATVAVVVALALLAPWWVAPLVALVAVTALVTWYERAYADAAAATRARLA